MSSKKGGAKEKAAAPAPAAAPTPAAPAAATASNASSAKAPSGSKPKSDKKKDGKEEEPKKDGKKEAKKDGKKEVKKEEEKKEEEKVEEKEKEEEKEQKKETKKSEGSKSKENLKGSPSSPKSAPAKAFALKANKKKEGYSEAFIVSIVLGVGSVLLALVLLLKSPVETSTPDSRSYLIQAINHLNGMGGVTKDEVKGIELLKKAATLGHPEAQHRLGYYYTVGNSVLEPDAEEAFKWYMQAAKQGVLDSMVNVGLSLANGQGVEQDQKEAFRWWRKAANRGSPVATGNVGRCYEIGLGTEIDLEKAVEYYKKGLLLEDGGSMFHLGNTFLRGINTVKDIPKAIDLFQRAAEKEFVLAWTLLGELYMAGVGVEKDPKFALQYFSKAAQRGEPKAQYHIGLAYGNNERYVNRDGELVIETVSEGEENFFGLPYNPQQSFQILQEAAKSGSHDAMYHMALKFEKGEGIQADSQSAYNWLLSAAKAGNGKAALELVEKNNSEEFGGLIQLGSQDVEELLQIALRAEDKKVRAEALRLLNASRGSEFDEGEFEEEEEEFDEDEDEEVVEAS